ncbi:E3 ubiquitin-protein ligase ZNRF2-like [Solea senegalensis]|uniref:E3 ubiquitin-protein ligase ZNRF2-like n=1 Tax=Solea senegalensis TaxID=28829 RepID=A0AAV6R6Y5_SOLSE|nr:E3 ubiquitin-protein ligase ZNRF2-like [Solea senegalensis]
MGAKQSNPVFDGRTRAYSSSDLPSGNTSGGERIAGFRYTNGPDGPRIRYTGAGPTSSGLSIPGGGRSGSHELNQSLDGTDGDGEGELPPDGHRLLIGSLPAHLSPHLLGGKIHNNKSHICVIIMTESLSYSLYQCQFHLYC